MAEECFFVDSGECKMPDFIVADLEATIPVVDVKASVPLCIAHAIKPYVAKTVVERLFGDKIGGRVKVIPRDSVMPILEWLGLE